MDFSPYFEPLIAPVTKKPEQISLGVLLSIAAGAGVPRCAVSLPRCWNKLPRAVADAQEREVPEVMGYNGVPVNRIFWEYKPEVRRRICASLQTVGKDCPLQAGCARSCNGLTIWSDERHVGVNV